MSDVDYAARTSPAVYKPLIDEQIQKIATFAGADAAEVQAILDGIGLEGREAWSYLTLGLDRTKAQLFTDKVQERLGYKWSRHLWQPGDQFQCYGGETEDDVERDEDDFDTNYIVAEYYPEEAHEALAQDMYWGGADADVVGVWQTDGIAKIFHAHMEGFWILGEDPVDYIQKVVAVDLGLA